MENNMFSILMAVLPVLLYSLLVYYIVPQGFLSQRRARLYAVAGMLSPTLVFVFNYIFPHWSTPIASPDTINIIGCQTFIQIALVEEVAKFLTFWWVFNQRRSALYDLPIATIFYCMLSSAGFALIENISYLMNFGDQVLFIRAVSAIVTHMICGVIMGYFIQMAFSTKRTLIEKFSVTEKFKIQLHTLKFIGLGILASTIFHGIYDFNLFLPFNIYAETFTNIILFFGLFICMFMIIDGIRLSKDLRSKDYKKDLERNYIE